MYVLLLLVNWIRSFYKLCLKGKAHKHSIMKSLAYSAEIPVHQVYEINMLKWCFCIYLFDFVHVYSWFFRHLNFKILLSCSENFPDVLLYNWTLSSFYLYFNHILWKAWTDTREVMKGYLLTSLYTPSTNCSMFMGKHLITTLEQLKNGSSFFPLLLVTSKLFLNFIVFLWSCPCPYLFSLSPWYHSSSHPSMELATFHRDV